MPPSKLRTSDLTSKRRLSRARSLWIDFFRDALTSLISTDDDQIKELTDEEANLISASAAKIADKALHHTEERFPGL